MVERDHHDVARFDAGPAQPSRRRLDHRLEFAPRDLSS